VTDVKLKGENGAHGKVWGVLYWNNQRVGAGPTRVAGSAKRVWRWLPPEEELARLQPLAKEAAALERRQREATRAAAAAAGGGGGGK
jgi:hypothetical protein